jgi:hypothetical protein
MAESIPERAQFGLIGLIYRPGNAEKPWLVQDNRKALKSEYPCSTKAEALEKLAEILDAMSKPR